MSSKTYKVFFLVLILLPLSSMAQAYEVHPPHYIQTIEFKGNTPQSQLPIINLGNTLTLSFDDLQADEKNYYYRIQHYNFDWTPSDISKNEYLDGFDESRIKNYSNSYNTLQSYSHYELQIPNDDIKGIKRSGNYILEILDRDFNVVFSRKFMIAERLTSVEVQIRRSRDLAKINELQVVQFSIKSPDFTITNPKEAVKVSILQNSNIYSAIDNLEPQYTVGNELIYRYDIESSFPAGNEYLYFDSKDIRATANGIRRVELSDVYEHYLYTDRTRKNRPYTHNPDINGNFVIRNIDAANPAIESEYVRTHFALRHDENIGRKEIHLYGNFNNYTIDNSTYMAYNSETGLYENSRLFKQGFYNYKYVTIDDNGYIDESAIDGDFWQTENDYTILVYYREVGARYDRIIGVGQGNSTTITN